VCSIYSNMESSEAKNLLKEINEVEKSYNEIMKKRLSLYDQLKELDIEESLIREVLSKKKDELRSIVSPLTPRSNRTIVRTVSLTFKKENPLSQSSNLESNSTNPDNGEISSLQSSNNLKQKKTIPKYLENIDVQMYKSGNVWETLYQTRASSEFLHLIPQLKIKSTNSGLFSSKSKNSMFSDQLTKVVGPFTQEPIHSSLIEPPEDGYKNYICARSISTYPPVPSNDRRDGDPVCDRYHIEVFSHGIIMSIADGCNWGSRPRNAAIKATEGFINYFKTTPLKDLKDIGRHLFKAISNAHNNIIQGHDDVWESGTTTLLGALLMEVTQKKDKKQNNNKNQILECPNWAFMGVSVGDCKAFRWSNKNRKVIDITEGNRSSLSDPTDPGGRIGPYLEEGAPDLRNIDLYFEMCEEGDLILLLSDGVHDNLDPQFLGKLPSEFNIHTQTWKEAELLYPDLLDSTKTSYRNKMIEDIIDRIDQKNPDTVPIELCKYLMNHCEIVTKNGREFLIKNHNKRIPENIHEYPGKMDHATACCIRVGKL